MRSAMKQYLYFNNIQSHVFITCDAGLLVEGLEPLLWEDAEPHLVGQLWPYAPREVDQVALGILRPGRRRRRHRLGHGGGAGAQRQHRGPADGWSGETQGQWPARDASAIRSN